MEEDGTVVQKTQSMRNSGDEARAAPRGEEWQSCAVPLVWIEFTADIIEHCVREVTEGERFALHSWEFGQVEWLTGGRTFGCLASLVHLYHDRDQAIAGQSLRPAPEPTDAGSMAGATPVRLETPIEHEEAYLWKMRLLSVHSRRCPIRLRRGQSSSTRQVALEKSSLSLEDSAFDEAMGLPEGFAVKCPSTSRGNAYVRMLCEEVSELEGALGAGVLCEILAESVDVIYPGKPAKGRSTDH